ncbi:MFS general substrate transporter [Ramicandelaber brevisporus]|nr:MFS general substrate transporter [Ramicandelaber brevisporus]
MTNSTAVAQPLNNLVESDEKFENIELYPSDSHEVGSEETDGIVAPDGGYGWVVVACAFFALFASYGLINAFGVFATYYSDEMFTSVSSAKIALIGTLQIAALNIPGPLIGYASEVYGYRLVIFIGGVLIGAGMIIASFATANSIWLLLVAQGVVVGLGAGCCVTSSVSIPSQWFDKRRGLATGIAFTGSGLGGVVFAPVTQRLLDSVGVGWAMRILGIICFVLISASAFFIRTVVPPTPRKSLMEWKMLKNGNFLLVCLFNVVSFASVFVPYVYLSLFATKNGYTAATGATLVALINVGSTIGRVGGGLLADKFGNLNFNFLTAFLCSIVFFCFWLPASTINPTSSLGLLIAFSLTYGLTNGAQIVMLPLVLGQCFGVNQLATLVGASLLAGAIGVLPGTPGAGALLDGPGDGHNFTPLILYSGFILLLASLLALLLRFSYSRKIKTVI